MTKNYIAIAISILLFVFVAPILAQEKPPAPPDMKSTEQRAEAEILAFLVAVDEHEVAAGKDAFQKSTIPAVRQYAQMMINDHSTHLQNTNKLINSMNLQPWNSPDIDKLKADAEAARTRLAGLQGAAFESAYIEQMVKDHADALDRIDNHYMKEIKNDALMNHLRKTRAAVQRHHEEAQRIQGTLKK